MNSINGGHFVWICGVYKQRPAPRLETKCQTGAPSTFHLDSETGSPSTFHMDSETGAPSTFHMDSESFFILPQREETVSGF